MPTLEHNKRLWDGTYHWRTAGQKWSSSWGGPEMQWHASILPRIHQYVPAKTILEIAPGFGRWTQYLKELCNQLIVIDLSEKCIESCRNRFGEDGHIIYHVNDGRSLDMIPDESIDFAFTYDSLVHAEDDVIASYLQELARKLTRDGVGFIHHSNAGEYASYFRVVNQIRRVRPLKFLLRLFRIPIRDHKRGLTMTAEKFRVLAHTAGLHCVSQELINWRSEFLLDCHSVITRVGSPWVAPSKIMKNQYFMDEAKSISVMSELYKGREDVHRISQTHLT